MGGNATKDHNPQRLNTKEAMEIGNLYGAYLRTMLRYYNENPLASVIKSYGTKETHGDIDVLVNKAILKHESVEEIVKAVSVFEGQKETFPVYKNSDVISIANYLDKERTKCFQIDLIFAPEEKYNFAKGYFAYNDLGNLVGRVAHNMGLKFGHDGLWYPFRVDDTHLFKELLVTDNFAEAMEFLGFSIDLWNLGFDDLEDIYEFVAESEYFNRDLYPLEHRSNKARVRDRKRPTYTSFLKWLDEHQDIPNKHVYHENKDDYLEMIFSKFPDFEESYWDTARQLEINKASKAKLNGKMIGEWTGLEGKDLGSFIVFFKNQYGVEDSTWNDYVLGHEIESIQYAIMKCLEKWNETRAL